MRVLVDTNVVMDYIADRKPFATQAFEIIERCINKEIKGCIAAHTIMNLFYILRKDLTVHERKAVLSTLCRVFTVISIDEAKIISALKNDGFDDFEDCLQEECAISFHADFIVTRNTKDFANGTIKAIEPVEFLTMLD